MALHKVVGTIKWAKVFEHNRDMNKEYHGDSDGAYLVDVYLDGENLATFQETGSRARVRVDEEGSFVKLKRRHAQKEGEYREDIQEFFGAPKVVDKDEQLWDTDVLLGNGSLAEVYFSVYNTGLGKGTRLVGMKILEHVAVASDEELPF